MKEVFIPRNFSAASLQTIETADQIVNEYISAGFVLTLRQLYYQFVQANLIENKQSEYKRLGSIINDARLAGMLDWDAFEDRGRSLREHASWGDPEAIMSAVARDYREPLWESQDVYLENWIEKDSLIGILEPVSNRWRVPYFACRGNNSQTEQYKAGKRLADKIAEGKRVIILYLGDHDPTGVDITRDNRDRLSMFAEENIEVRRLALNYDQIDELHLPHNPAKDTDSRKASYFAMMQQHGFSDPDNLPSWELDALKPQYLDRAVEDEIKSLVDLDAWNDVAAQEKDNRETMRKIYENWTDIQQYSRDL